MQKVRTNNDVEGWHYRLNRNAGRPGLQLYLLIELLHREATFVEVQARLVEQENLHRCERKEYRVVNERIHQLWEGYNHGDVTWKQLHVVY